MTKTSILTLWLLLSLWSISAVNAQEIGVCGTTIQHQQQMAELFKDQQNDYFEFRGDKIYIPVKFHIVANSDGSERIKIAPILNQLALLNKDYDSLDIVFYLKDNYNFNYINSTAAFESPGNNEAFLKSKKDPNALNIFITKTADTGTAPPVGIVLGYYSPGNDFVICRKEEFGSLTNTLSHEVGHFLSLRHTFYGWEGEPYLESLHGNPYTKNFAPGTNIPVELVNGSNCETAADMICDTPPDFNFGIRENGCTFSKHIFDKNGQELNPMKENQMSYFGGCAKYKFTEGQGIRMLNNYNSSARDYLRSAYVPNTTKVDSISTLLSPPKGSKVQTYNSVLFQWQGQPNATYYVLEVQGSGSYFYYFTTDTQYLVTDLAASSVYVWTVRAFNDGYTDGKSPSWVVSTGTQTSATFDVSHFSDVVIYPNPIEGNREMLIKFDAKESQKGSVSLTDISGKIVLTQPVTIQAGTNQVSIALPSLQKGVYIMAMTTDKGKMIEKIAVQ